MCTVFVQSSRKALRHSCVFRKPTAETCGAELGGPRESINSQEMRKCAPVVVWGGGVYLPPPFVIVDAVVCCEGAHRVLCARCAKSRLFSTTGSHGPQGHEFCTLQPLLVHQGLFFV